jgi:putative glutathione S-transferase
MGLLVEGQWHTDWYDTKSTKGEFVRQGSQFHHWIGDEDGRYPAQAKRYHLFVSLACPWAHRTLIFRSLKGLEEVIGITVVKPEMLENGWEIAGDSPVEGIQYLHELYTQAEPTYSGRVTVPVLWDTQTQSIVNNESADIIRMLNTRFNEFSDHRHDYYPQALQSEIDEINDYVYDNINNGVYKAGFATTQAAYERAFNGLFTALDEIEARLENQPYLVGEYLTEADWRLFTTLIRFDSVYHGHFKCNARAIEAYPNLSNYVRALYQHQNVRDTVNFEHIKKHYYYSHDTINPTRIVPMGPNVDYDAKHNRARFQSR